VSGSSPTTGAAKADQAAKPRAGGGDAEDRRAPQAETGRLAVGFEILRGRSAGWAVFGLVAGVLLIAKMGTVAQWLGGFLVVIGALAAWTLTRTFVFPAGTIVVDDDGVSLPRGQCTRAIDRRPLREVTAAYFLRRSVPWTRAAPVLVIEAAGRAYAYPRDWFVNEAEQRQIIHAILGRIRPDAVSGVSTTSPDRKPDPPKKQVPRAQ
jgi:hypothetical protein